MPWGWNVIGVLLLLCLVVGALSQPAVAFGMLPFVVATAMFSVPLRSAVVLSAALVLAEILAAAVVEQLSRVWLFVTILVIVTMGTLLIKLVDLRHAERQRLAQAEERERLARDLHDVLGHSLTVITVKSELAERLIGTDPQRVATELAEIRSLTREALAETRAIVSGLRVARLGEELASSGSSLADAGIEGQLPTDAGVVDPRFRIVLAWTLRETMTNVLRHSQATMVQVELGSNWMRITDDGIGLRGAPEGNGLGGLRQRVSRAGGTVDVADAWPGTSVMAQL